MGDGQYACLISDGIESFLNINATVVSLDDYYVRMDAQAKDLYLKKRMTTSG